MPMWSLGRSSGLTGVAVLARPLGGGDLGATRGEGGAGSSGEGSSGRDDDPTGGGDNAGMSKKFSSIRRLRRRWRRRPKKMIRSYVSKVRERLGVTSRSQVWHLRDWSRRIIGQFGRRRQLHWRIRLCRSIARHCAAAAGLTIALRGACHHIPE